MARCSICISIRLKHLAPFAVSITLNVSCRSDLASCLDVITPGDFNENTRYC